MTIPSAAHTELPDPIQIIVAAIEAAPLSAACYRAARRLLDIAARQSGGLTLSRQAACDLFGVGCWGSVRRMLGQLRDAGILDYHTNNRAYVIFPQFGETVDNPRMGCAPTRAGCAADATEPRTQRASARIPCADDDPPRIQRAPARTQRASARIPGAPLIGIGIGIRDGGIAHPTLDGGAGETPPAPDQARSIALLTDPDIDLARPMAVKLAEQYPLAEIRRQVFRWARDRTAGRVRSPGAIVHRLKNGFPATVQPDDRHTALWLRHADPAEETTDRARRYSLDPEDPCV